MRHGIFYCIGFMVSIVLTSDELPSIVFVHLGNQIPEYLFDATAQAHLFNPTLPIVVIADQSAFQQIDQEPYITFVACQDLCESSEHALFKKISNLDRHGRDGFWFKATERFFYIDELMRQRNMQHVFHLEYDNMLYVDLLSLMPVFERYDGIAATFDADNRCIPGFIYFARADALHRLVSYIAHAASSNLNDMEIIAAFRKTHDVQQIDHLPIIFPEYIQQYGLGNALGFTTMSPENYTRNIHEFDSIFDAAALGQFLGGIDPRNGHSAPGFINETCLFNAARLHFQWHIDDAGRKVPYAYMHEKKYRINNLHIHSKNLKAFCS